MHAENYSEKSQEFEKELVGDYQSDIFDEDSKLDELFDIKENPDYSMLKPEDPYLNRDFRVERGNTKHFTDNTTSTQNNVALSTHNSKV